MIKYMFMLLLAVSAATEIFFYRRYIKDSGKKWLRRLSLTWTGIIYLLVVILFALFGFGNPNLSAFMIWVIWFFLLNLGVKLFMVLFGIGNIPWLRKTGTALGIVFAGVMIWGMAVVRTTLRVERIEIVSDRIPEAFDGYKIVQFSDVHLGNLSFDGGLLRRMAERINGLNPDLIVQTGDLFNLSHKELTEEYRGILGRLKARDGIAAVYGNHDLGLYVSENTDITPKEVFDSVAVLQEKMGWRFLKNENFHVYRGADSIAVAGVLYPRDMFHNGTDGTFGNSDLRGAMRGINDGTYTVMLSHTPRLFDSIPEAARPDLMLSGHVHAMQMKFGHWSPAEWMYPMYSGRYDKAGSTLYINDGIGYVLYPFRIGTKPEITEIILKHKKSN